MDGCGDLCTKTFRPKEGRAFAEVTHRGGDTYRPLSLLLAMGAQAVGPLGEEWGVCRECLMPRAILVLALLPH